MLYNLFIFFVADFLMFDCGCNFSWTSPAIATLRSEDLNINPLGAPITPVQESWIAALVNLGAAVGPLVFGKFADIFGRKKTLIMITVLKILSYVMLAYARNIYLFYLARFLIGVGMGLSFAIMPMYTGEISEDHNRGRLVSIMGILTTIGMLYTLIIGPLMPLKIFTLSCMAFLIISLIGFLSIVPEAPAFLINSGKMSSAKKVLMKLRNLDPESAEKDLAQLARIMEQENSDENSKFVDIFRTPSLRKGIIICLSLCSLQHLSGIFPIMAFIGPIFDITGSKIPTDLSIILVSMIQLISNIISSLFIEKLGRKPLLLISTIGTSLTLAALGTFFYLKDGGSQYVPSLFWLPVTCLTVYMIAFSIGLCNVPLTIVSEVFPSNVRSTASSFVAFCGALTGSAVTFIFPIVMANLGGAQCFGLFAVFTALGAIFISVVVPETKGKSISEIQMILSNNNNNNT